MEGSGPSEEKQAPDDFLIAEYEHFADSFWRNEELGEKRINFFISLLTATVAGLVVLATSDSGFSDSQVQWLAFSAGLVLLIFGVATLLRMLRRNEATDEYKRAMGLVRASFSGRYGLTDYRPFEPSSRRLLSGGLAQTTALLNGVIVAAVTATGLLSHMSTTWLVLLACAAFVATVTAQLLYVRAREAR